MRLESEGALCRQLREITETCLERLTGLLRDEAMEAKELVSVSKEARAMAELVSALDPAPPVQDFHLTLCVEDGTQ